jgi:hypothetical protein
LPAMNAPMIPSPTNPTAFSTYQTLLFGTTYSNE